MTTVVLGWDGLDPDRLQQFGMAEAFGSQWTTVDTLVNSELGKPHTYELWPSIITGTPPADHGIHADEYIEGAWQSPWLRAAARLSHLVPDPIRWRVGRMVRNRGAEYAFEHASYYQQHDIRTVFDGRESVALGVPNYRSTHDETLGIVMDRGAALGDYLDVTTADAATAGGAGTVHRPSGRPGVLGMRLEAMAGEKLAAAANSLTTCPDLVFVWLGYLDTVGHVAPTLDDPSAWYQAHYEHAAQWTAFIRERLRPGDELLCLSDHGLEDGQHTREAYVGARHARVSALESVLDVYDLIDQATDARAENGAWQRDEEAGRDVEAELEDLGYL